MMTTMNEDHICSRCGHTASTRSNLYQHLRRKTPCQPSLSDRSTHELLEEMLKERVPDTRVIPCPYCSSKFSSRQAKSKHLKKCKPPTTVDQEKDDTLVPMSVIDALMDKKFKELTLNATNNGTINTGTINNITIQVQQPTALRNFGEENMDAAPLNFIRSTFMNLEFRTLFENLHCDPEYPENHNVRIKSVKRDMMEIYDNNKWNTMTSISGMKKVIEQLYLLYMDFRKGHLDDVLTDMSLEELNENEKKLHEISAWISNTEAKLKQCAIAKEIAATLESNRNALLTLTSSCSFT